MPEPRADVLLVYLHQWPILALAPASLVAWARRDPELSGLSFGTAAFDQSEPSDRIARAILAREPRLIGFSCYVWNHAATRAVASRLKELAPSVPIIVGGPQVALAAVKELESSPQVDYVCCGEGEETFRHLLRCLFRQDVELSRVPGLVYRSHGRVLHGPETELIDLKEAPSPYLAGLLGVGGTEFDSLETSRGCPFLCAYCNWGLRTVRYISDDRLQAEFAYLAAKKSRHINSTDADLTMNKQRCIKILKMFLDATEGTPCMLSFEVNPVFLVPEIVDVIARAPEKFGLACGLQSIREDVLRKIERSFDRVKIERNMTYLRAKAPRTVFQLSTIYGLPGDDIQGLRETLDWCMRWRPDQLRVNHPLVLPGTDLEKNAGALGLIYQKEPPHHALSTDTMSREDLGEARVLAVHVTFLGVMWEAYSILMQAAAENDRPLGHIGIVEAWIVALKSNGVRLPGCESWREIDDRLIVQIAEDSASLVKADPVLNAALMHTTRELAERWLALPPSSEAVAPSYWRKATLTPPDPCPKL